MRNLITLVAVSAALSASILTGLASADVPTVAASRPVGPFAETAPAILPGTASNQPLVETAISCSLSAWSQADGFCVTHRIDAGPVSARRVRIIRLDAAFSAGSAARPLQR
ncbi:MAG: hypothetical protein K2Y56_04990 [Methylobacterium sp.]|uniref:hypothetical protein n=1 Tax=Methylobacterium sp. TaxID=409 RepID=UPI0025F39154|nr:hypothetical protein [Methylobacterium sp.]MBX9930881.1 hypothetical protein [Methylobacterium sp.]